MRLTTAYQIKSCSSQRYVHSNAMYCCTVPFCRQIAISIFLPYSPCNGSQALLLNDLHRITARVNSHSRGPTRQVHFQITCETPIKTEEDCSGAHVDCHILSIQIRKPLQL